MKRIVQIVMFGLAVAGANLPAQGRNSAGSWTLDIERTIMLQLQQHGVAGLRVASEVQSDRGLHLLGLAGGAKVDVENEVHAGVGAPRHAVGFDHRAAARLPREEVTVGIEGLFFDVEVHAGEAGAGDLLRPARGARTVEDDIGVVKRLGVAGPDFDGLYPTGGRDRDGKDEIPEDFGAVGGELVGL